MEKAYAYLALPMEAGVLAQLLSGLNSSFWVKVEEGYCVVIYREEY